MSENIKSYRIRTNVGEDSFVSINLEQDYDSFDILSLTINTHDIYKLHNSNYGVIVGRVLANNGFGVPNAKISVFIEADAEQREELSEIYAYTTTADENKNGVRYNLLPDNDVSDCHQIVGTFPNKRYVLDNDDIIEVFEKYFKYTTRTNSSGDYIICGVPTGTQTLHMDLDLSDCGILSQKPRDFVYKGYTIEQFENPNMFKTGTSLSSLSQIFTQDQNVYVQPFWGNDSLGETIGITRADINVEFKFEPTCVFMGSVVSDNSSNGISKKCKPTEHMGDMDELTTGEGNIEMIRKTYSDKVEEFRVKGTELINGSGVWCYQIPMNLDYMVTDEYGSMVPTDNPDKGIPTRARVRFRISLHDMEENTENFFRPKVLVPHNPQNYNNGHEDYDYNFGTATAEESFRDLYWNNVYTVKSYIPRFQKKTVNPWNTKEFTGIKGCQMYGKNNPIPYNNIRIKLPLIFQIICIIVKALITIVGGINRVIDVVGAGFAKAGATKIAGLYPLKFLYNWSKKIKLIALANGLCPDLENWYFAPILGKTAPETVSDAPKNVSEKYNLLKQTLSGLGDIEDNKSIDAENEDTTDKGTCLTSKTDYLISCFEMNLAQEYRVINFDFYNDWINGMIYIPRFMRDVRKKVKFLGIKIANAKVRSCMDNTSIFSKARYYTQMCSLSYAQTNTNGKYRTYTKPEMNFTNRLHKNPGTKQVRIFGGNGGIVHESTTMVGQHVYYLKPCEWRRTQMGQKINLFATDIVLLGSLNSCDPNGVPQAFKHLVSSTYIMPTNLALTNLEEVGTLYSFGEDGVVCSKTNQSQSSTISSTIDDGIIAKNPSESENPLTQEYKFYEGTSLDAEHEGPNDTIAVTEAAGISWNFTGPGQERIDKSKYYYPGGHFLGLSCFDSQTNIKSCLNLERICEIGTNMSQRKEIVRANDNGVLSYEYIVPTGLISGNDIVDEDFRSMFATMNKSRLRAETTDRDTGYQIYKFIHVNPTNFNGELSRYTNGAPYNKKLDIYDESETLADYGVDAAGTRDDNDNSESGYTFTKTIENISVDYYLFRMGLAYTDLTKITDRHKKKFAFSSNETMLLPQYENSYYFYFGLQNGLTALDEFNKQFFSECPTKKIAEAVPSVYVTASNFNICSGKSNVYVQTEYLTAPYSLTITRAEGEDMESVAEDGIYQSLTGYTLPYGNYILSVVDKDGNEFNDSFSVGEDFLNMNMEIYDFFQNIPSTGHPAGTGRTYVETGGYVKWSDVSLGSSEIIDAYFSILPPGGMEGEDEVIADIVDGSATFVGNLAADNYHLDLIYELSACDETITSVKLDLGYFSITCPERAYLTMGVGPAAITLNSSHTTTGWVSNKQVFSEGLNTDSIEKWMYRKCIINPYSGSSEIFSSRVKANNGKKAIWMRPQNEEGCFEPTDDANNVKCLRTNLYYDDIPNGYSVDDDATYWSATTPQIYALAYDDATINMFQHCATATGNSGGYKDITIVSLPTVAINGGAACMFKPLPEGPLFPCRFNFGSPNPTGILCLGDDNAFNQYQSGLVYTAVMYPIYKKPFYVDANYYYHQSRIVHNDNIENSVPYSGNEQGVEQYDATIEYNGDYFGVSTLDGYRSADIKLNIKNGVTLRGCFGGESYIGATDDITPERANEFKNIVSGGGIMQANSTVDRTITIQRSVSLPEEINTEYKIVEGYPHFVRNGKEFSYKESDGDQEVEKNIVYENITEQIVNDGDDVYFSTIWDTYASDLRLYPYNGGSGYQVRGIYRPVSDIDEDVDYYVYNKGISSRPIVLKREYYNGDGLNISAITYSVYSSKSGYTYARVFMAKNSENKYKYIGPWSGDNDTLYFRKSESSWSTSALSESNLVDKIEGKTNNRLSVCDEAISSYSNDSIISACLNSDSDADVEKLHFDINGWAYVKNLTGDIMVVGIKRKKDGNNNVNICRIYHKIEGLSYTNHNAYYPFVLITTNKENPISGLIYEKQIYRDQTLSLFVFPMYTTRFNYYKVTIHYDDYSETPQIIGQYTSQEWCSFVVNRKNAGETTEITVDAAPCKENGQDYPYSNYHKRTMSFTVIWE